MKRPLLGVLAATVLLTLSACGDGDGNDRDTDDAKSDPTSASSSDGTVSADDVQAKLVAGVPPKDLTWVVPTVPSGWRDLETEQGTRQWQVGDSRCVVTINQPAGLGTDTSPTSEQVAADYATTSVKSAGATADLDPATQRLFTNHLDADGVQAQSQFAGVHFTATPGDVEGQAYGYRAGDFALRAVALCGDGQYADNSSELEGFLEGLAARTTY